MWIELTEDGQKVLVNFELVMWIQEVEDGAAVKMLHDELFVVEEPYADVVRLVKGVQS